MGHVALLCLSYSIFLGCLSGCILGSVIQGTVRSSRGREGPRRALYVAGTPWRGQRGQVGEEEAQWSMSSGLGQRQSLVRHRLTKGVAWVAENGPESGRGSDH